MTVQPAFIASPEDSPSGSLGQAARAWAQAHGVREEYGVGVITEMPRPMYCEHVLGHSHDSPVITTRSGKPLGTLRQLGIRLLLCELVKKGNDGSWYPDPSLTARCPRCR